MHYVYLTNNVVTDQCQVDPYSVFSPGYAEWFIEAPDEVTFNWKLVDGSWVAPPGPTPDDIKTANKQMASQLLQLTDWTTIPDVANPEVSNPYLTNSAEFASYRNQVRQIAINPPSTPVTDWPTKPTGIWSS